MKRNYFEIREIINFDKIKILNSFRFLGSVHIFSLGDGDIGIIYTLIVVKFLHFIVDARFGGFTQNQMHTVQTNYHRQHQWI